MKSRNQRDVHPVDYIATGFVQTMYFDMKFNYLGGRVEQASIFPDAPENWESESSRLIPYVRYEYTRVCKDNPETSRSAMTSINLARKRVRQLVALTKNNASVLRVVKEPIIIKFQSNLEATINATVYYLEESLGSLNSDPIASERKTREMPPDLKEKAKTASKKSQTAKEKSKASRVK
jgi:hypothetical protein